MTRVAVWFSSGSSATARVITAAVTAVVNRRSGAVTCVPATPAGPYLGSPGTTRSSVGSTLGAAAGVGWAWWVGGLVSRPVRWLAAEPSRLLTVAWLVGLMVVGHARVADAAITAPAAGPDTVAVAAGAPDGIIVGPDLAGGAPLTLFESYDFTDYQLTVRPDDDASGWFGTGAGVLHIVGVINNVLLWVLLGLLFGALTLLEWLLNLTVYQDSAPQIDAAVRMVAAEVFWPLIAATVAIGGLIAYARWRADGRSYISDLAWVFATAAIGMAVAAGPSTIMTEVDGVRQDMAASVTAGAADYTGAVGNPVGFDQPVISGERRTVGTRTLVDSMWNTFGATSWCYAQFRDLEVCREAGSHALARDDQWQRWMQVLDDEGAVPEFRGHGDWIRGQEMARTGYLLALALIVVPLAVVLLRLVLAGLVAVTGLVVMLIVGFVLLVLWPIPGWCRDTGTRTVAYILGFELQALFITVIVAGVMVGSTIIGTLIGDYSFFAVAVLNLALITAGARARDWLESLTTTGGAHGMGLGTMLLIRSAVHTVGRVASGAVGAAGRTAVAAAAAGQRLSAGPGWAAGAHGHRGAWRGRVEPRRVLADLGDTEPVRAEAHRPPGPGSARFDAAPVAELRSSNRRVRAERADMPAASASGGPGAGAPRLTPLDDRSPSAAAHRPGAGMRRPPPARRALPPGDTDGES